MGRGICFSLKKYRRKILTVNREKITQDLCRKLFELEEKKPREKYPLYENGDIFHI